MEVKSKQDIINDINSKTGKNFTLSNIIYDDYLLKQEQKIFAKGYGIYDTNKQTAKHRYCLIIDLDNNGKNGVITAILMNPSNTFPKGINNTKKTRFDQTIRNIIKLVNKLGYRQLIILNSFPYICSNGKEAEEYYKRAYKENSEEDKINKTIIDYVLSISNELLIACGDGVSAKLYQYYCELIQKYKIKNELVLLTYAEKFTITKKRPRHFSLQSEENRNLYNYALENKLLWQLTIENNKFYIGERIQY